MLVAELNELSDRAANAYRDAVQARAYAEEVERRMSALVRELDSLSRRAAALEAEAVRLAEENTRLRAVR